MEDQVGCSVGKETGESLSCWVEEHNWQENSQLALGPRAAQGILEACETANLTHHGDSGPVTLNWCVVIITPFLESPFHPLLQTHEDLPSSLFQDREKGRYDVCNEHQSWKQ